jgi:hypothetical protein
MKFYDKGSAEAEIKAGMHEWVANSAGYAADPAYADSLFEKCHGPAFEHCYSMGGRRTSAKFDDGRYIAELTAAMSAQAQADGRAELAVGLQEMKRQYDAAPE